jgi:hypothetical protein
MNFLRNIALHTFNRLEEGILRIVRAADLYAVHYVHEVMRGTPIPTGLIDAILKEKKISGFNVIGMSYTRQELRQLSDERHFQEIAQQILVATHTALESYLISKFEEYYRFRLQGVEEEVIRQSLERFHFRGIEEIKSNYLDLIGIHIPSFEINYPSTDGCNFQPASCWEAIQLIYKARNEIVHRGESSTYPLNTLMDSWYPFEFSRRWVALFDANFNSYLYEGHETSVIKEYRQRAKAAGITV